MKMSPMWDNEEEMPSNKAGMAKIKTGALDFPISTSLYSLRIKNSRRQNNYPMKMVSDCM